MILLNRNEQAFWKLDSKVDKPLYAQLEDLVQQWIDRAEIGERLPAELDIADWASVTRKTVRKALKRFIDEDYFVRRARVGTVLVKKNAVEFEPPHPFEQSPELGQITPQVVKLILFAGTQVRKDYWMQVIDGYNRDNSFVTIEPVWTPVAVCCGSDYQAFIEQQQADLIYVGDRQVPGFIERGFLQKLSSQTIRDLKSEAFLSNSVYARRRDEIDYAAPLNFPLWGVLVNEDLVGHEGPTIPNNFTYSSLIDWLTKLNHVPQLLGTIGKLIALGGIPEEPADDKQLAEWLTNRFEHLSRLKQVHPRIKWFDSKPYESVEEFLAGKSAVYIGNLYPLADYLAQVPFRWRCSVVKTNPSHRLSTGFNNLAIPVCSKNPTLAENFINYMISDTIMEKMAGIFRYAVFRRESNRILQQSLFTNADDLMIQATIDTHIVHNEYYEKWAVFFEHQWKAMIRQRIVGTIDAPHAVETIMRDYQSFRHRTISEILQQQENSD